MKFIFALLVLIGTLYMLPIYAHGPWSEYNNEDFDPYEYCMDECIEAIDDKFGDVTGDDRRFCRRVCKKWKD